MPACSVVRPCCRARQNSTQRATSHGGETEFHSTRDVAWWIAISKADPICDLYGWFVLRSTVCLFVCQICSERKIKKEGSCSYRNFG
jgi:hypothetical protein